MKPAEVLLLAAGGSLLGVLSTFATRLWRAVWPEWQIAWAEQRMLGCSHARTEVRDLGSGSLHVPADKCLDCWALRLRDAPRFPRTTDGWFPNVTRP
jgi:hypothetical protein